MHFPKIVLSISFLHSSINFSFDFSIIIKEKSSLNIGFKSSFESVKYPSSESLSNFKFTYNFGFFKGIFVETSSILTVS